MKHYKEDLLVPIYSVYAKRRFDTDLIASYFDKNKADKAANALNSLKKDESDYAVGIKTERYFIVEE